MISNFYVAHPRVVKCLTVLFILTSADTVTSISPS